MYSSCKLLQVKDSAQGTKVDSQEKADALVLDLNGKVEKLRFCVGSSQNLLQHPLPANARLPPELAESVMLLIEEIQRIFVQVQGFEGGEHFNWLRFYRQNKTPQKKDL